MTREAQSGEVPTQGHVAWGIEGIQTCHSMAAKPLFHGPLVSAASICIAPADLESAFTSIISFDPLTAWEGSSSEYFRNELRL